MISDRGWEKILNSDAPIRGRRDAMPPASHGHPSVVILAKRSVRLSRVRVGSMRFRRRTRIPAASHPGDTVVGLGCDSPASLLDGATPKQRRSQLLWP